MTLFVSPFAKEPPFFRGKTTLTAVLYCNLGTPETPCVTDVRRFLAEFLSDPRVVEVPRWIWWVILHGIILRFRPARSAAKYASIWTKAGSPLKVCTEKQARLLQDRLTLQGHHVKVVHAMRYGQNSIGSQLDALKAEGCTRVLVVPAYPQYSATTTGSVLDAVFQWAGQVRRIPELRFVNHYHDDVRYVAALAERVTQYWQANGRPDVLVMSFHGLPKRSLELGDPYHSECHTTARLLAAHLGLGKDQFKVTFQSRLGRAKWLQPYTEPTLTGMGQAGVKRVDVICPAFTCDCLETLEEINLAAREAFLRSGGQEFHYIACLNDAPAWITALADITVQHLQGWPTASSSGECGVGSGKQIPLSTEPAPHSSLSTSH